MKISVVILTYNRNKLLKKCLDSLLMNQTMLPDEIVVVNSGLNDIDAIIADYLRILSRIKIVKTANVSLADNRNAGVKACSCDLVAFTDDDCEVSSDWVEGYLAAYYENDASIGSIGGYSFDANADKIAHKIEEISLLLEDYHNRLNSPFCYYFCTRNACYRKKVLEDVGFFEGTYRKSFEDVIIGLKILKSGYKNVYHPGISVRHYGRGNLAQSLKRMFEYGRDMYAATVCFSDMLTGYVGKARRSVFYIIFSTFAGPIVDVFRFRKQKNPLSVFFCSFMMKSFVNAGMLYERMIKRCD